MDTRSGHHRFGGCPRAAPGGAGFRRRWLSSSSCDTVPLPSVSTERNSVLAWTSISGSATLPALFWGLGLEYGLTAQWTAKVETDFVHYAATDITLTCAPVVNCGGSTGIISTNSWGVITKIGLNYRF